MKKTKLLLSSFVLAAMFSACANEDILEVQNNDESLAQRTQVNLTLSTPAETRMGLDANGNFIYTTNDVVGAVLVDAGYSEVANSTDRTAEPFIYNNVDWTVVPGHVGNNKWFFDGNKRAFSTKSTTAVGAWLFYSKYNAEMTTTRDGVKTNFPQIQEGATNWKWLANNNINFVVSPILNIDGYEGENINLPIKYASVYNYLNIKLKFKDDVTKVNKILVSAKANGTDVYFPSEYRVLNQAIPAVDLSLNEGSLLAVAELDNVLGLSYNDQRIAIENALWKMNNTARENGVQTDVMDWKGDIKGQAKNFVEGASTSVYPYLVVDCDGNHADTKDAADMVVTNGNFNTWMLMPAGVYDEITLTIYTDKGVYTQTVDSRTEYIKTYNAVNEKNEACEAGLIYLRPNTQTSLANIERRNSTADKNFSADVDYVYVNGKAEDDNNIVTKTSDLISLINSIKVAGLKDVNIISQEQIGDPSNGVDDAAIPEHALVVNADVMAAIEAKEAELKNDIQLNFLGARVKVVGNSAAASRLDIHDMTFNKGCDVVSGFVTTSTDLIIPELCDMSVEKGADVALKTNYVASTETYDDFCALQVEKGAVVTVVGNMEICDIINYGTFATEDVTLSVELFTNSKGSSATFKGNVAVDRLANNLGATLVNDKNLTIYSTEYNGQVYSSKNAGNFTNNGVVNVKDSFDNVGTITNADNAKFVVNAVAPETAVFVNKGEDAVFTNSGMLYTTQGDNKIHNYATIEAKADSYTYITTNSLYSETTENGYTGAATQVMGTIKMEKRNAEIKVSALTQQGYKEYTVADSDLANGVLGAVKADKFNKVVLSTAATLSEDVVEYLNFVVTTGNLTLPAGALLQEVTFNADANLYAPIAEDEDERVKISNIVVAQGKQLRMPTENAVYVYTMTAVEDVHGYSSTTAARFNNYGEMLVGGDVYTQVSLTDAEATSKYKVGSDWQKGLFSTGFGEDDVFHWSTAW